jgi:hypothetical protein
VSAWHDTSDSLDKICPALVAALGKLTDIPKGRIADTGKYRYSFADLSDLLGMARPILTAHGLAVLQPVTGEPGSTDVLIFTTILHESGQFITLAPLRMAAGTTPQATGSAITYGRRYALLAALGLAAEDDDGQSAASTPTLRSKGRLQPERPSTTATQRTPEEARIRALLADLAPDERAAFREAFVDEWGCPLSELEPSLHPAALAWLEDMLAAPVVES